MKKGGRAYVTRRKNCIYWEIGYVVSEASARFSIRLRRQAASSCHQRYYHPSNRKGEYQSLPGGLTKSKDAKSGIFATRRPFCLCFVRAGVLGESSVALKPSSGDHERESWIGIPLFNFRMFTFLKEMKREGTKPDLVSFVPSFFRSRF